MDEETRSFEFASTKGSIWTAQISTIRWFANQYSTDESIKKQCGKHHKKPIPITPDSLFVGFSNPKPSIFTVYLPPLSFCAKPKAKSQNPHPWMNPRPPGEGDRQRRWVRANSFQFPPHLLCRAPLPKGEGFSLLFINVDSATPGKPCVQNDMKARWQNRRRNPFI